MSKIRVATPGLLFGSFLYRHHDISEATIISLWEGRAGASDYFYPEKTPGGAEFQRQLKRYYSKEMGAVEGLSRFMAITQAACPREELVEGKLWAIEVENSFMRPEGRSLNLDIGMLTLENFQLATGKNFTHRQYISRGIFADLTLIYEHGLKPLPWSYKDYSDPQVTEFLNAKRQFLLKLLNHQGIKTCLE